MSSKRKNTPTKLSSDEYPAYEPHHQSATMAARGGISPRNGEARSSSCDDDSSDDEGADRSLAAPKRAGPSCRDRKHRRIQQQQLRSLSPDDIVSSTEAKSGECLLKSTTDHPNDWSSSERLEKGRQSLLMSDACCLGDVKDNDDVMESIRAVISSAETMDDKQRTLNVMISQLQSLKDKLSLLKTTSSSEVGFFSLSINYLLNPCGCRNFVMHK